MRSKHLIAALAAASLLILAAVPTAQAASGPSYGLTATYAPSCTSEPCLIGGVDTYDWTGTASCIQNCTGVPASGDFALHLSAAGRAYPPSPCVSKRVTGTFSATWSDATLTTASLSGRSQDGKSYSILGTVDPASTHYPSDPIRGTVAFPPTPIRPGHRDACTVGTVSYPSDPMRVSFGG
jgi:hypothetical protein